MRPLGSPPTPSATSSDSEPVGITSTCKLFWSPKRMMEPLPYIFSIWPIAASMARFLSSAGAAVGIGAFSFAIRSSSQF